LLLAAGGACIYYCRQRVAEKEIEGYHEMKDMDREGAKIDGNGAEDPGAPVNPTQEAAALQSSKVMYRVSRNVKIGLHERPDSNSAKTGKQLEHGECFEVDETKVVTTDDGKTQIFCIW
jgi:hypothetical protein